MRTKAQRKQRRKERKIANRQLIRSGQIDRSSQDGERSEQVATVADLQFRAAPIGTVNESDRTVVATLTTEQPVLMYDYRTGRGLIDEILVARGGQFPEQLVMLDDHDRFSGSRSVFGSIRAISLDGDRWRGTLHFARNAGSQIDEVWELVRQKHLTDVSLGYRYGADDYVDIPAGRTEMVNGKNYTAGPRVLRVVTSWSAREGSVTPIGADDQAKIGRASAGGAPGGTPSAASSIVIPSLDEKSNPSSHHGRTEGDMKKYLKWLQARGLAESVTDQTEALNWARRNLAGDLLAEFATVCRAEQIEFDPQFTPAGNTQAPAAAPVAATSATPAADQGRQSSTMDDQNNFRRESDRLEYIRQLATTYNIGDNLTRQAIRENWTTEQINTQFLAATESQGRSEPLTPAIHTRQNGLNLRTLQAAMLLRSGIEADSPLFRTREASHVLAERRLFQHAAESSRAETPVWIANYSRSLQNGGQTQDDEAARAFDRAWEYRNLSMVDFCRAALEVEGSRHNIYDRDEIVQRSFSTATLGAIFTTNFAAQLLAGFMGAPDTTGPWTGESDLPNFQTVERIQMHKLSSLKKTDRYQTPSDAEAEAVLESYKLARYAERFTVDEMDIIDDRFGALDMTPNEMGEAARELRPDLVYSILLGNPTMGQDSTALFHADHGNLTASGAALSLSTIEARKSAMASQTSNGRLLNIMGQYLIVPETKAWTARRIIGSEELRDTTATTLYGTMNPARGAFQVVSEPRLDVGVTDPSSGTTNAGQPGSWFLSTANGRHGIEVGHLRGTGRAPVVRRYDLQEGRIGMGWLVIMYVAAKAIGYQGLAKSAA